MKSKKAIYLAMLVGILLGSLRVQASEAGASVWGSLPHDTLPFPVYQAFSDMPALLDYRNDTTYVINFWATWCVPCVQELPYFERLQQEMAEKPVRIVMVSLDFKKDIPTKLLAFVRERPFTLPLLALADGRYAEWIDKVDPDWEGAIPFTIVYKGDRRTSETGKLADYNALIQMLLAVQ
jgi:thiol-disulfide isomerase/thioredoxin